MISIIIIYNDEIMFNLWHEFWTYGVASWTSLDWSDRLL